MRKQMILPFLFCLVPFMMKAQIRLPGLLSSNMVLQQNDSVTLWGWANPLEKIAITTSWNGHTDTAVTQNDAKWSLKIKTAPAGGPYTITFSGYSTVVLTNVMMGEVWICAGQSNMEWNFYSGVDGMQQELSSGLPSDIRLFQVPKATAPYQQENISAQWVVSDSNTIKTFSAIAYFFGKKLQRELKVPVGLINASWGATPAEVWTPAPVIAEDPVLKAAAEKQPERPWCPRDPGVLYNSMIAPLHFYPIAGSIWYQGESNTGTPDSYAKLLTAMINSWRTGWKREFPFYLVQIAPFNYGNNLSAAILREQESLAAAYQNNGLVVISDLVSDTNNIHPRNKKDVGIRLANYALAETYHQENLPYKSPSFRKMEIEDKNAMIYFNDALSGIIAKDKQITALQIAGSDRKFYPAEGKLKNSVLVVWSKQVKQPIAVRYMFSNAGIGNLFSKEGLPVAPFRTDDWKVD